MIDSLSEPIVSIRSTKENPLKHKRDRLVQQVLANDIIKKLRVNNVDDPQQLSYANPEANQLESVAISEEMLPQVLIGFMETAQQFFQQVAVSEGLISPDEQLSIRIKFIDKNEWQLKGVLGIFDESTNTAYIKFQGYQPQNVLSTALTAIHELRHRVTRRYAAVNYLGEKDDRDHFASWYVTMPLGTFSVPESETFIMEEVFVTGFVSEYAKQIIYQTGEKKMIDAWNERTDFLRKDVLLLADVDETLMIVSDKGLLESNTISSYSSLYKIYLQLKEYIPNLLQLCTSIRRGDLHAKSALAQAIRKEFGKKALAALSYSGVDQRHELFTVIRCSASIRNTFGDPDFFDRNKRLTQRREEALFNILSQTANSTAISSLVDSEFLTSSKAKRGSFSS